jgi:hypothetical protein
MTIRFLAAAIELPQTSYNPLQLTQRYNTATSLYSFFVYLISVRQLKALLFISLENLRGGSSVPKIT